MFAYNFFYLQKKDIAYNRLSWVQISHANVLQIYRVFKLNCILKGKVKADSIQMRISFHFQTRITELYFTCRKYISRLHTVDVNSSNLPICAFGRQETYTPFILKLETIVSCDDSAVR